jgi:predicted ATPase with chaperone activity
MDVVYYEDATMEDAMEFLGAEKEEERGAVRKARKARNRQSAQRSRQARYLRRVNLRTENKELERMAALVATEHEEVFVRLECLRLCMANKEIKVKRRVKTRMLAMSSEADLGGGKKMM